MKLPGAKPRGNAESGVALLVSLFALLLICVVGVALIMASGTHTALTGNYRSSIGVYYGALAGLEEGRGRLLPKSQNYFNGFVAPPGYLLAPGQVRYVINPMPGETVAPWDLGTPTSYPDTEYIQEFGANPPTPSPSIPASPPATGVPPFLYKWVRINAITATSVPIGANVKPGTGTSTTPVLYANNQLTVDSPGVQALEITSLAALPNGSQRMLQYIVAPISYGLSFPAALTLEASSSVTFTGPGSTPAMTVDGTDVIPLGGCNPGLPVAGIGTAGGPASVNVSGVVVAPTPPPPATATTVTLPANLQTVSGLETLIQTVEANADVSQPGPQTQSIFPVTMSPSSPAIIAVDGDLDLSTFTGQGFGILLVTGKLTYNPAFSWTGIILAIGQGVVLSSGTGSGTILGAALVAQTRDNSGNVLPALGPAASWQASGGLKINYSVCWVNAVQSPISYKILSFREIPQNIP